MSSDKSPSGNNIEDKINITIDSVSGDGAPLGAPDSPNSPDNAGQEQESHEQLKERLNQKEAEAVQYLDALKRVQAEMENYRKRMLKEQSQIIEYATQTVITELLPVLDNMERALGAAEVDNEGGKLREGVELIYSQLKAVLEKECVEVIDPVGKEFDPTEHEAVMQVESDGYEENTVVEVLQKGYSLKGRLLRPAMVKVSR